MARRAGKQRDGRRRSRQRRISHHMQHELTKVSPDPISADKVATFDNNEQEMWMGAEGKVLLVTHKQLKSALAIGRPDIQKGFTIAIYLGCGEYSVSMLSLCLQLHHFVTDLKQLANDAQSDQQTSSHFTRSPISTSPFVLKLT